MAHARLMNAKHTCRSDRDLAMQQEWEQKMFQAILAGRDAAKQLQTGTVQPEDAAPLRNAIVYGEQCRGKLALSYLPMVTIIARRYSYSGLCEELVQEGMVGILQAIDICADKENRFIVIKIIVKQALYRLLQQKNIIRFPPHVAAAMRKISTVSKWIERDTGHIPQAEHIAEEMQLPIGIVRKVLSCIQSAGACSLDTPASEDSDDTFVDLFATTEPTPEEVFEQEDLRTQVLDVLKTLEPLEESTIKLRFGFIGGEIYTAEETAQELRISLEDEQRLEIKAMRKLRHPSRSTFLREYL